MIVGITGLARSGKTTAAEFLVKNHNFVSVSLADPMKRALMEWFDWTEDQLWGEGKDVPDKRYPRDVALVAAQEERCIKCGAEHVRPYPGTLIERVGESLHHGTCPKGGEHDVRQSGRFGQYYLTPRHALQQLGTEFGRTCFADVWAAYALRVAKQLLSDDSVMYLQTEGVIPRVEQTSEGEWRRDDAPTGRYKGVVIPDVRFENEADVIFKNGGDVWRIVRPEAGLEGAAAQHSSETEQARILCAYTMNNVLGLDNLEDLVSYGLKTTFDENGVRRGERK